MRALQAVASGAVRAVTRGDGRPSRRSRAAAVVAAMLFAVGCAAQTFESGLDYAPLFEHEVDRRLNLPPDARAEYARLLATALSDAQLGPLAAQFFLVVDRSPRVQAAMLYWLSEEGAYHLIGASPCSTGLPGRFEYFETPLGVFEHRVSNLDFRAEGTKNEQGVRGYGVKGMRVFDFGWVNAPRGWGDGRMGVMRLQVHATDPDLLEWRLGSACSKGCIRIPATLNVFLDRYGLLDADYDRAAAEGRKLWMLRPDRQRSPWAGRYLVVVDSRQRVRPDWSPAPRPPNKRAPPSGQTAPRAKR